jgi:uncharacterized protein (TIGR01777 family)
LIGRHLQPLLRAGGHEIVPLRRRGAAKPQADGVVFDPAAPDVGALEGFDAVIHLAGESIAQRWTKAWKERFLASRGAFTAALCGALAKARRPPAHVLSASATGYYPLHVREPLNEGAANGDGFLALVCREWEAGTRVLETATPRPRVAILRIGVVLTPEGGALAKMLPAFRWGLGGVMGSGEQMMGWISLPDVLAAIVHVRERPGLEGPINLVSPGAVTNREFTMAMGRVLGRPAVLPVPAVALKVAFGEMARETILASQNVVPARLVASGFEFRHLTIEDALRDLLRRE